MATAGSYSCASATSPGSLWSVPTLLSCTSACSWLDIGYPSCLSHERDCYYIDAIRQAATTTCCTSADTKTLTVQRVDFEKGNEAVLREALRRSAIFQCHSPSPGGRKASQNCAKDQGGSSVHGPLTVLTKATKQDIVRCRGGKSNNTLFAQGEDNLVISGEGGRGAACFEGHLGRCEGDCGAGFRHQSARSQSRFSSPLGKAQSCKCHPAKWLSNRYRVQGTLQQDTETTRGALAAHQVAAPHASLSRAVAIAPEREALPPIILHTFPPLATALPLHHRVAGVTTTTALHARYPERAAESRRETCTPRRLPHDARSRTRRVIRTITISTTTAPPSLPITTTPPIAIGAIAAAPTARRTTVEVITKGHTVEALPRRIGTRITNRAQGRQDLRNQTPAWLLGVRTHHTHTLTAGTVRHRSTLATVLTPEE